MLWSTWSTLIHELDYIRKIKNDLIQTSHTYEKLLYKGWEVITDDELVDLGKCREQMKIISLQLRLVLSSGEYI